jgi:hypothetical protein
MAVFEISFFSDALGRIAPMTAIVPIERPHHYGGSGKPASEPFRAVYLLHGYSGCNTDWIRGSRIEQLAMAHNIAVFMPSGENGFYLDDPIRGAYYSKLICEDIIDFTMGGYGALRNGLYRSDVFGNIIAFSSAILTDELANMRADEPNPIAPYSYYVHTFGPLDKFPGSDKDPKALAKALLTEGKPVPNIYIACGTEDFGIAQNRAYHNYLEEIGLDHVYMESAGEHNWAFWDEYIEKALCWLDEMK